MIYNYNNYELVITYNARYEQYDGACSELGIYISSKSKDGLEKSFRERVDDLIGS